MFDYRSYWTIVEQKVRDLPMVVKAGITQARCRMFGIREGEGEQLAWWHLAGRHPRPWIAA
jgi:hypothetical protein